MVCTITCISGSASDDIWREKLPEKIVFAFGESDLFRGGIFGLRPAKKSN